ncbi:hypothetical protein DERP_005839 [Dermatophagoides pteronyssinus]|uniref:Uncharacterized protein n=1 Tax=Dermatophagoides pteronyssinus TaxID=6956 RepID=A0ABQ8J9U5_DERPT|nr:hypothetical protein DERP_005839 [Dermatophagoides pteronyssinus]
MNLATTIHYGCIANRVNEATLRLALMRSRCSGVNDVTRRFSLRRSRCSSVNADTRRFALIISRCSSDNGERNFFIWNDCEIDDKIEEKGIDDKIEVTIEFLSSSHLRMVS